MQGIPAMAEVTRLTGLALLLACLAAGPAARAQNDATALQAQPPAPAETQGQDAAHAAAPEQAPETAQSRTPAPHDAYVYLGWPQDKTVIRSTRFKLWFGARNIGVAPAGVTTSGTGHHHLLVDVPLPDDMNAPVPNDKNHLHFGAGQTETMLELPPGTHTLQLLMCDAAHVPHDPPLYSRRVTVVIRPGPASQAAP